MLNILTDLFVYLRIENDVIIAHDVKIKNCVYLHDGITIEEAVFIGAGATFCNDKYQKSKNKNFSSLFVDAIV